jgi:hypothetical protein
MTPLAEGEVFHSPTKKGRLSCKRRGDIEQADQMGEDA